jgi:hypothetical protein
MEPQAQSVALPVKAAPGMDVLPPGGTPAAAIAPEPTPAREPAKSGAPVQATEAAQPAQPASQAQPPAVPKKPTSTTPHLAVVLALIFFLALSALAYYAYTKTN